MSEILHAFLASVERAQDELAKFEAQLEKRHEHVTEIIEGLSDIVRKPYTDGDEHSALHTSMSEVLDQIRTSTNTWRDQIAEEVQQQEFSSIFDQSLIVMVYGKVNSGKSSLGNFLAGQIFDELGLPHYRDVTPRFRLHASAGRDEIKSTDVEPYFAVDAQECTREIQEFTLGGLSWVDTPGIHSLNEDNQALARKYVESAELVIYLTDSSAPARQSDMQEMSSLLESGKRAIIVVSKFDRVEEDIDDNGDIVSVRVIKSDENRRQQRQWIETQINDHELNALLQRRHYCFVSTKVAEEALARGEDPDTVLRETGLADLYERLGETLTENAIELKKQMPRRRFNALIDAIAGTRVRTDGGNSLTNRLKKLRKLRHEIERRAQDLQGLEKRITSRALNSTQPKLEARLVESHDRVNAGMNDPSLASDSKRLIEEELVRAFNLTIAESFVDVLKTLRTLDLQAGDWNITDLEATWEEVEISTSTRDKRIGSTTGGLLGGGIGMMLGGTAGAMVGSFLGGWVGSMLGEAFSDTVKERIKAGTNLEEVAMKLFEQLRHKMPNVVRQNLRIVEESYFAPLLDELDHIETCLKHAQNDLNALRYKINLRH